MVHNCTPAWTQSVASYHLLVHIDRSSHVEQSFARAELLFLGSADRMQVVINLLLATFASCKLIDHLLLLCPMLV